MNLPKTDLRKYTKALRYGDALRPSRDWFVLLAVALVLIALSLAWNLWTFEKVVGGESLESAVTDPLPRAKRLEAVTAHFERRALEAERYLSEYRFVDPSGGAGTVILPASEPAPEATSTAP